MNQVDKLTQEVRQQNKRLEKINRDLKKQLDFYETLLGISKDEVDEAMGCEEIDTDTEYDTIKLSNNDGGSYIL